jgi:hypothetical protein
MHYRFVYATSETLCSCACRSPGFSICAATGGALRQADEEASLPAGREGFTVVIEGERLTSGFQLGQRSNAVSQNRPTQSATCRHGSDGASARERHHIEIRS